jgi:hypothetical protein
MDVKPFAADAFIANNSSIPEFSIGANNRYETVHSNHDMRAMKRFKGFEREMFNPSI